MAVVASALVAALFFADGSRAYGQAACICNEDRAALDAVFSRTITSDIELHKLIDRLTARLRRSPCNVHALVARGYAFILNDELNKAEADLAIAIRRAPKNCDAWHAHGATKLIRESPQEALEALKRSVSLGSTRPSVFFDLGRAYVAVGNRQEAMTNYSKAIERNHKAAYFARALLRSQIGQDEHAIADFDKAIELKTVDDSGCGARAASFFRLGKWQEAITDYTRAIEAMPEYVDFYSGRAESLVMAGDWDAALADYNRMVELEPKSPYYRGLRGSAYIKHGEYDKGTKDILEAIHLNPGDVGIDYRPKTEKELSPEALAHGEEQIRRMLKDRPVMAEHVSPGDELWTWAVRKFAGEDLGALIDWDPTMPEGFGGFSRPATGDMHPGIRVALKKDGISTNAPMTFEQLWSTAAFELHNI